MVKDVFCDGIGAISMTEGMVRIDLISLQPNAVDPNKPTPEIRQRVVLTPQAFLQSVAAMQSLLQRMEEAGVVRRTPAGAPASSN
jgi:hypothetical protein